MNYMFCNLSVRQNVVNHYGYGSHIISFTIPFLPKRVFTRARKTLPEPARSNIYKDSSEVTMCLNLLQLFSG
jgi:hypothetical protein